MNRKAFIKRWIASVLICAMLTSPASVMAGEQKAPVRTDLNENNTSDEKGKTASGGTADESSLRKQTVGAGPASNRLMTAYGNGRFSENIQLSVPKLSDSRYDDIVSFSLSSWSTTGAGRHDSAGAMISLSQSGNSCSVFMSDLLDYENYSVHVSYVQTYFYDVEKTETLTAEDGSIETYTYTVMESRTVTGSLMGDTTTPQDSIIRSAYDLNEKVHKYPQLSLACDVDCGSLQSDIDGDGRSSWMSVGDINRVTITGNGNSIKRQQSGFIFHIYNGAELVLNNTVLRAYEGDIVKTETVGGEYETLNPTSNTQGAGIEVGFDSAYDNYTTSPGKLTVINSTILAHNSAVIVRNGSASIKSTYLYGMGDKDVFSYTDFENYVGMGILAENSGDVHADIGVSDCRIYGRFNGILLKGDTSSEVTGSEVRSDCGDAFDFRSSGTLDIKNCMVYGVKGIDVFDDATYAAVSRSIKGDYFDREVYQDIIGEKGKVTVSDTTMSLNTGAFTGDASMNSFGIQNRGNLTIGKNVKISSKHSGAWKSIEQPSARASACGIYNVMILELPEDIMITADDKGISENRNIGAIRNTVSITGGTRQQAGEKERVITSGNDIGDLLDMGQNSVITLRGGSITAGNTAIEATFGSVYIEPENSITISGRLCGIYCGKNGTDNIFGDDAPDCFLQIDGRGKSCINSSLQGTGICVKESGRAALTGKNISIADEETVCGTGVKNEGKLLLKNASIKAQEAGIYNLQNGVAHIGNDLDETGNRVYIAGAICGIENDGIVYYYRNVCIEDSIKAGVWQNGIFYMLPGAIVKKSEGDTANTIYLTPGDRNGKNVTSTVRILFAEQYEKDIPATEASFNLADNDRKPGRVMIELYSEDGNTDYSDPAYTKMKNEEKIRLSGLLSGFSLSFSQIQEHKADLRSGLGTYTKKTDKSDDDQPDEGEETNGRTGTVVLSCLLTGQYDADFPVKRKALTFKTPEATSFYWKEPTEFTTAPLSRTDDRCRVFFDKEDVTAGLKQMGYRDKEDENYGDQIYDTTRIIRIFDTDHVFAAVWDTDFSLVFDGNGQTNKAKNYSKAHIREGYIFEGNTGPDGRSDEYFVRSISRKRFDLEKMRDMPYLHQTSFQGWSFVKTASYKDSDIYCCGDRLHGSEEIISDDREKEPYASYDAIAFYVYAMEKGSLTIKDDKAEVRIYAVWDEFPVISARDTSFYADEISDVKKVRGRLMSESTVSADDYEDGTIDRKYIEIYTNPVNRTFSIDEFKEMGDLGSITVYYSVTDKNEADRSRFRQNTSVTKARVYVLSEDAEDTTDDIPVSDNRGNAGTSTDSYYSAPVYVRAIGKENYETLETNSVWREDAYKKILGKVFENGNTVQKWEFETKDVIRSKKMLYEQNADPITWKNAFLTKRVYDEKQTAAEESKPLIIEEGLSSLKVIWDIKTETDRIDVTVSQWGRINKRTILRDSNQKIPSYILFDDLAPDSDYLITVEQYSGTKRIMTLKETAHTKKLETPEMKVYRSDFDNRIQLHFSIEKDEQARKYLIERKCIKGEKTGEWNTVRVIDDLSENDNGERYLEGDVIRFEDHITDEGVFRYRVKAYGKRIGSDDLSEESSFSDEYETAFLKKPVIKSTEPGCRSIKAQLNADTAADFVRIYYQQITGEIRHQDLTPDKDNAVIISEDMTDNTIYGIKAEAHIVSPLGGKEYKGLMSEASIEKTHELFGPELLTTDQKDIYTGEGIRLVFEHDARAVGYEVKEDVLHPEKTEGSFLEIREKIHQDDKHAYGEYQKKGGDSRVSEYTVRAVYKTLDGKTFYIKSDPVRAAYIRTQDASGTVVDRGEFTKEMIASDEKASCYLIVTEDGTIKEEVYVPAEQSMAHIYSPDRRRQITQVKTVLIYDGTEYRAA